MSCKTNDYNSVRYMILFMFIIFIESFTASLTFLPVCSDPTPTNGSASLPSGAAYGQTAYISCDTGYALQGERYIICQAGAIWSDNTTCIRGKFDKRYSLKHHGQIE